MPVLEKAFIPNSALRLSLCASTVEQVHPKRLCATLLVPPLTMSGVNKILQYCQIRRLRPQTTEGVYVLVVVETYRYQGISVRRASLVHVIHVGMLRRYVVVDSHYRNQIAAERAWAT